MNCFGGVIENESNSRRRSFRAWFDGTTVKTNDFDAAVNDCTKLTVWGGQLDQGNAPRFLTRFLPMRGRLTAICLAHNRIGDAGARVVARYLARSSTLKVIDLSYNEIGNVGAFALARALKRNQTLQLLRLKNNGIGDAGAHALANAVFYQRALLNVDLLDNAVEEHQPLSLLCWRIQHNHMVCAARARHVARCVSVYRLALALRRQRACTALSQVALDIHMTFCLIVKNYIGAPPAIALYHY